MDDEHELFESINAVDWTDKDQVIAYCKHLNKEYGMNCCVVMPQDSIFYGICDIVQVEILFKGRNAKIVWTKADDDEVH